MASAPLIGISGRTRASGAIDDTLDSMRELDVDLFYCNYAQGVIEAGGLPVFLPSSADPADYASRLDGLLLSGGADIAPARYGQVPSADLFTPEPARDAFEMALLDGAAQAGVPVLGICRGIQTLNVHGGGTLHQHVAPHACFDQRPNYIAHRVGFTEGSLLASLYGPSRKVNSLHHQSIDRVADGFVVTARSDDGSIEGIESAERPWLGVQWHPEMMDSRACDPVFGWLVESASG